MVLRCSLLGHDFDDPRMERDREIRGSEVVVTVEEYEECTRCNERNVLSENTEVTTLIDESAEQDQGESADTEAVTDASSETTPIPRDEAGDPIVDDGEILEDDSPTDRQYGEWPDSDDVDDRNGTERTRAGDDPDESTPWPDTEGVTGAGDGAEYVYAEDDGAVDAELLGGDDAVPAANQATEADASGAAEPERDSLAADDATEDDAVFIDAEANERDGNLADGTDTGTATASTADDERTSTGATGSSSADASADEGGVSTVEAGSAGGDAAAGTAVDESEEPSPPRMTETGFESAGPVPSPGADRSSEGTATEFFCPRCSFVASGDRGSLRPGDICPECRRGYLGERPR